EFVDSQEKLDKLAAVLKKEKSIAIDVQTAEGTPLNCEPVGLALSAGDNMASYIPLTEKNELIISSEKLDLSPIKDVLENPKIERWGNGRKSAALALKKIGINMLALSVDTQIAAYLCNPGSRSYDVDSLSFSELGMRKYKITKLED